MSQQEQQTKEGFAALGEFIQEFGLVCQWLQFLIVRILEGPGTLTDQQLGYIIVAHRAIAADALISMAQHMVGHIQGEKEEVFTHIVKRFDKLKVARNDILHGHTYIGWGSGPDDDYSKAKGYRLSFSSKGSGTKTLPVSTDELRDLIKEAKEVSALVGRYLGCIGHDREIVKNFTKDGDKWLPVSPSREKD